MYIYQIIFIYYYIKMSSLIINNFICDIDKLESDEKDKVFDKIDKFIKDYKNKKLKNKKNFNWIKRIFAWNFYTYTYECVIDKIGCGNIKKFKKLLENEIKIFDFDFEHSEFGLQNKFKLTIYFNNFTLIFEYNRNADLKDNVKTNFEFKNDLKYNPILQEIIRLLYESDVHALVITIADLFC